MYIRLKSIVTVFLPLFLFMGCSQRPAQPSREVTDFQERTPGDSTVYALAAEGTGDSILVYLELPYKGADPDTVNVLEAITHRQMFGRPEVGDNVAIVLNDTDATEARCVIVTDNLIGQWCYEELPTLRRKLGEGPLPQRLQEMLEVPREYGIILKPGGVAITIGARARQGDGKLPVVYPLAKNYGRWEIFNGRLVFSEIKRDTADNITVIGTDTAFFIRMRRDTLVLRFPDGEHSYYKKESD